MKVPEGLTRAEQETFFRKSAADDVWDFYTRDPIFKRLLERRGYEVSRSCVLAGPFKRRIDG